MNPKPPQGPPTEPTAEEGPKILTFEEFSFRADNDMNTPRQGSFFGYFDRGLLGDARRITEHYKRFAFEHPDMTTELCDKIQNMRDESKGTSESLKPFDRDLYEAYKIMRSYGIPDSELLRG